MPPEKRVVADDTEHRLSEADFKRLEVSMQTAIDSSLEKKLNPATARMIWEEGFKLLRENAAKETGKWLFRSVGNVLRNLGLLAFIGLAIYWVGGWTALSKFLSAISPFKLGD